MWMNSSTLFQLNRSQSFVTTEYVSNSIINLNFLRFFLIPSSLKWASLCNLVANFAYRIPKFPLETTKHQEKLKISRLNQKFIFIIVSHFIKVQLISVEVIKMRCKKDTIWVYIIVWLLFTTVVIRKFDNEFNKKLAIGYRNICSDNEKT